MKREVLKWLTDQGCTISIDGSVRTSKGDYVTLATLPSEPIADLIYRHRLVDLQSLNTAKGKHSGNAVGIGFNKEEQKWYGFTHRGYGSFGIGWEAKPEYWICTDGYIPPGFKCQTLDDCKQCAICMSDYLD